MATPLQKARTQTTVKAERNQRESLCELHDSVRQVLASWKSRNLDEHSADLLPVLEAAWAAYEKACRDADEAKALERTEWNGGYERSTHRMLRSRCVLGLPGAKG